MKKYLIVLLIFLPAMACSASFGKNKVTQQKFDWFVHKTEHFDIYYYPSESRLISVMADIAEDAYDLISEELGHEIRDQTPLILYKSHADFRETNITLQELQEGVGGFAELFKHRVVIPFTGSMRQFRQVIFHELTHIFQYDIIYQKPIAHIYTGEFMYSPPIWFIEGMAEYFSRYANLDPRIRQSLIDGAMSKSSLSNEKTGKSPRNQVSVETIFDWDATDEMVLREASINNQIYHLQDLEYWLPGMNVFLGYKIGESAVKYLVQKYGRNKIALIVQELRHSRTKDLDAAFKNVIGADIEKFDKEWQNFIKQKYWPMIKDRSTPDLFADQLTKSKKYASTMRPAWLPSGDLIACITNENNYDEIILISAKNGRTLFRLTEDLYSKKYESIRTEGNGLSISRDGDRIAFVGIKGRKEYLFILNIVTKKLERRICLNRRESDFNLDLCYSPCWSPEGDRIVFVGVENGQPDLFMLSLSSEQISRITDDPFDDNSPDWHPFKDLIVYSSERGGKRRLIKLDLRGKEGKPENVSHLTQVMTYGQQNVSSPAWSPDGNSIIFCSDLEKIDDIYVMDIDGKKIFRLTDVMTGCFTPKIVPVFSEFGPEQQTQQASLRESIIGKKVLFSAYHDGKQDLYVMKVDETQLKEVQILEPAETPALSADKKKDRLFYRKYERKIMIDAIFADFEISSDGMLRNTSQLIASDMMGNHRLGLTLMSQSYNWTPDFVASYAYLARRTDLGVSLFNYHEYHLIPGGYGLLQRLTGLVGSLSYPINRYRRIDADISFYSTPLDYRFIPIGVKDYDDRALMLVGDLAFVGDSTKWNQFGPYTGARYNLTIERSFKSLGSELDMTNVSLDARKYFKLGSRSTLATRLFAAGSFGSAHKLSYLGGIDTLRGYKYEELIGTRAGLLNLEIRLPFVEELRFGWPFRWAIRGIRGIVFADFGTVWSDNEFTEIAYEPWKIVNNHVQLVDVKGAIGIGLRLHLGYFTLDFDVARRTNLAKIESDVIYHFGLGQEF